jgi:hypothetical protein
MTDDMTSTIKLLKNKLTVLEHNYEDKFKEVELRELKEAKLNSKLQAILKIQKHKNEIVTYNIGGEKIQIALNHVMNCPYQNIMRDVIVNLQKMGRDISSIPNVFIDRNPIHFKFISEIIRISNTQSVKTIILTESNFINTEQLKQDIYFYFKQDAERVLEEFEIVLISQDKKLEINSSSSNESIVNYEITTSLPGINIDIYRANSIKDITKRNSKKAFFVSYDSSFIIELNQLTLISFIEIKPFTFDLDSWIPTEGAGTFVFSSDDKVEWDFLNAIPEDYGSNMDTSYLISFEPRFAKYIKFQTGEFTLSLAHIKIG